MTDRDPNRPLEERPEVAAAVDDDSTVPRMTRAGGVDPANPSFVEPDGPTAAADAPTADLIGDPYAAGTGATGTGTGAGGDEIRTGAEQPWEPEDLVMARGQDLTPANLERARRDLAELGRAAVERTVP
ncbi:hypothetical protein [Micromonospora rifamycinica]|uniref:Uncharacterized protein n=1 Tax=Micromonospora rifamycinica TaxID=291594 RepID=A0A125Q205_9ACTN|nr:hypothetical protein [Micromonospora rifamycinica]KWV33801.1 hypothetical protein AWV63_04770 [Micromonospora rifamycinica]SCG80087.1 hypothetical protein GA0070623_4895 [Micromonospora rifamycinica]